MALTSTLKDVNPSDNIVARPQGGGGFVSSLARLGSGLATVAGTNQRQFEASEQNRINSELEGAYFDEQQRASRALELRKAPGVESDASGVDWNMGSVVPETGDLVGVDTMESGVNFNTGASIPGTIKREVDNLVRIQTAVNRGVMPASSLDLNIESTVERLFRQNPENRAGLAQYMQQRGIDHFLFRELTMYKAAQAEELKFRTQQEQKVREAAINGGYASVNDSLTYQLSQGQKLLRDQTEIDLNLKRAQAAEINKKLSDEEKKAEKDDARRGTMKAAHRMAQERINGHFASFMALTTRANASGSPLNQADMAKAGTEFTTLLETDKMAALASLRANGAEKDDVQSMEDYYDEMLKAVSDITIGPMSANGVASKIFQRMQEEIGVTAAETFPLWTMVSKVPGLTQRLADIVAAGNPGALFTPEQRTALRKELQGFSSFGNNPQGMYRLYNAGEILAGRLSISNLPNLDQARAAINDTAKNVAALGRQVTTGGIQDVEATGLLNGGRELTNALLALTTSEDPADYYNAGRKLGNLEFLAGVNALAKDATYGPQAQQLAMGLRAAAQDSLIEMTKGDWQKPPGIPGSLLKLEWDATRGVVDVVIDEAAYKAYAAKKRPRGEGFAERGLSAGGSNAIMTRDQVRNTGNHLLNKRKEAINSFLNIVVATSGSDPSTPAGVTPKQMREAAFAGRPLESLTKDSQENIDFRKEVQKFRDDLARGTQTRAAATAREAGDNASARERRNTYEPTFIDQDDALAQSILLESGPSYEERVAVASTILNRMKDQGTDNISDILFAPNQFEAWTGRDAPREIDRKSKAYKDALAIAKGLREGTIKPGKWRNFYNKKLNAQLAEERGDRRAVPAWDQGNGQQIGMQLFF